MSRSGSMLIEIHENIFADPVSQNFLYGLEPGRIHRADIRARRVDEIDDNDLVFNEIIEEANRFSLMGLKRNVWKVVRTPSAGVLSFRIGTCVTGMRNTPTKR